MSNPIVENLGLKDIKKIFILGLPSSLERYFTRFQFTKNISPLIQTQKVDFSIIFVINRAQLMQSFREILTCMHNETIFWVGIPKQSSRIVSDLYREGSWDFTKDLGYSEVGELELDHVWIAKRFVQTKLIKEFYEHQEKTKIEKKKKHEEETLLHSGKKKKPLTVPDELVKFFAKKKEVKAFFYSLSVASQNQYIKWIEEAKKEETRLKRIDVTFEKLIMGKRTPTEK
ncbi:MAG: YdeI/OmpD-associated family protein [Phycisphaerales bacterium]|nr:YdeI/OmpD-associated family protein [Phycisphaerales bacterium]